VGRACYLLSSAALGFVFAGVARVLRTRGFRSRATLRISLANLQVARAVRLLLLAFVFSFKIATQ
jgi:hypothetical protein